MSCSWPMAETTGVVHAAIARHERLVREGREILQRPAAACEHDHVDLAVLVEPAEGTPVRAVRPRPAQRTPRSRTEREGKRRRAFSTTSCLAAASRPQTSPMSRGKRGRTCLRSAANRPSAASAVLSRSSRASRSPRPRRATAWTRSDSSPGAREQLGPAVHVHAVAVLQRRLDPVVLGARHPHLHGRAALQVLQRPEDERPAGLAAEFGDLALHPHVR